MSFELNYSDEAKEFKRIYNELAVEYANRLRYHQYLSTVNEKISAQNKRLRIQRKNLLLKNDELIVVDLAKEEHSRVLNLEAEVLEKQQMLTKSKKQISIIQKQFVDLQVKFQNYKEGVRNQKVCETPNATASNALFEINKLKAQHQARDDAIRHLQAEKDILSLLSVGPTDSSLDTKALETENAQLKKSLTSFKVTHVTLDRCYQELSKTNNHLRSTSLEKIAAQREEIATLKAEAIGKKMNGPTGTPKPKVLASIMYTKRSKYIVPPRRADWVPSTPLPKKKQVTHREPQRTSPRFTQKPPIQHKKPTVPSVKTKPHQAKRVVNTLGNAWKNTKDEVARIVPIWKPTGRRFNLCDFYGTQKSTEHIVKPSELTPCVSPSTNATL
nr:hypothetical protein [Tanacetum cinerariifolium]